MRTFRQSHSIRVMTGTEVARMRTFRTKHRTVSKTMKQKQNRTAKDEDIHTVTIHKNDDRKNRRGTDEDIQTITNHKNDDSQNKSGMQMRTLEQNSQ
jgi:hypothetical protein